MTLEVVTPSTAYARLAADFVFFASRNGGGGSSTFFPGERSDGALEDSIALSQTDLVLSREPFQFGRSANVAAKPDRWTHVADAVQNNRMSKKWIVPKIRLTVLERSINSITSVPK
jgi:hypothetical protein